MRDAASWRLPGMRLEQGVFRLIEHTLRLGFTVSAKSGTEEHCSDHALAAGEYSVHVPKSRDGGHSGLRQGRPGRPLHITTLVMAWFSFCVSFSFPPSPSLCLYPSFCLSLSSFLPFFLFFFLSYFLGFVNCPNENKTRNNPLRNIYSWYR